ncbi:hypothetical protein CAPTEDRAFT_154663 [Capitella teleta]|uniref:G-protein coupled receptors family 1 profile domain-containing protein n=1 Tax=Capitella teleta TaxID=283909 RepID=R7TW36_CAPTE|nr:hypothetical protein CAPTEDRAFT_154663 [Capitella teleta]|eukprot:ELT95205.1 hypothetical protein CAPTEDRAFT_154663 [Capitella teleta]
MTTTAAAAVAKMNDSVAFTPSHSPLASTDEAYRNQSLYPDYGFHGCVNVSQNISCTPFHLETDRAFTRYSVVVYGFVSPALVIFTLMTNSLVCLVLIKKHMRTPTNVMLLAMAVSDMLTGVWSVPCFIYFYTLGHYHDWVPYDWCMPYLVLYEYMPTVFHTASIWLTVALAVQRYIYVCHSMKAKRWCTIPNAIKGVLLIYALAFASQINRFVENDFLPISVYSTVNSSKLVQACQIELIGFVQQHDVVYFSIYWWSRVIFIHLIPCTSLVILNSLLICTMKKAQRRRDQLLKQNRKSESRRLQESNCTTAMLVTVVGVFLLVEFPLAVFFILMIFENTFNVVLINDNIRHEASLFINLAILLSYPINFFIYCGMSRQFRETFMRLFKPGTPALDREHSQYISLATENGAKSYETKDTAI